MVELRHQHVATNGVVLHVVTAGPPDAPAVVLLHGFPEFWASWRPYIAPLVEAGYQVIVPDQRGYASSEKPRSVKAYTIDELSKDVLGLLDRLNLNQATLVGHDWGAAVAWWTAMTAPERVRRLVAINVPHPLVLQETLKKSPRQLARSWYMFFFQLPLLPEKLFGMHGGRSLLAALRKTARPGAFSPEYETLLLEAWGQPGAARGMLSWYRAALGLLTSPQPQSTRILPPTLILWGVHDVMLERSMAEQSLGFCDRARIRWFEEATHWVTHEEVAAVTSALLDFFRE